jgi:hypothetical protein
MQWRANSIGVLLVCALVAAQWAWLPDAGVVAAENPRELKLVANYDTITGTLEGYVYDAAGIGIPDATVKATNEETGNTRTTKTNDKGYYSIRLLPMGIYKVEAFKEGFVALPDESSLIKVRLNTKELKVPPIKLVPAPTTPPPTPPTPPVVAPTDTASTGQLTNQLDATRRSNAEDRQVLSLPLADSRTFDVLATLAAGVAPPPQVKGVAGPGIGAGIGTAGQFAVNGQRARSNNFTVDGSDNNDEDVGVRRQGFSALVPQSIESVKEVQIVTSLWDAEAGRSSGSQVNAVSRSGANNLHGTLYDFFNHDALNARNFFDYTSDKAQSYELRATVINRFNNGQPDPSCPLPAAVRPADGSCSLPVRSNASGQFRPIIQPNPSLGKDQFQRNQGGGVIGFPLWKDRTFFFGSFERLDVKARQEQHFSVPTVAQRGFLGFGASGFTLTQGTARITFFPTVIVGDAVFSLFPFPNNPIGPYGANTYTQVLPADGAGTIFSLKLDHNFKAWGRDNTATGRYNFTDDERIVPSVGGAIFSSIIPRVGTQNLSLFLNSQFSDRLANQLRGSYGRTRLRFAEKRDPFLRPPSPQYAQSGPFLLNAPLIANLNDPQLPARCFANPANCFVDYVRSTRNADEHLGTVGQVIVAPFSPVGLDVYLFPQARANNTIQAADTLTQFSGDHTFKYGFDLRRTQLNSFLNRNYRPQVVFGGTPDLTPLFSQAPVQRPSQFGPTPGFFSGSDLAAYGIPTSISQALAINTPDSTIGLRFWQLDFFFNDNWRARRGLTLDYGLRYELNTVPKEVNRRIEKTFALDQLPANDPNLRIAAPFSDGRTIYDPQRLLNSFNATLAAYRRILGGRENIYEADRNNFGPRFALAWDPFANSQTQAGKTAVRAGFGVYHDLNLGSVVSQSRNVFPTFVPFNVDANTFFYARTVFLNPDNTPFGIFNPVFVPVDVFGGTRFPNCAPIPGTANGNRCPLIISQQLNSIQLPGGILQQVLGLLFDPSIGGGRPSGGGLAFTLPDRNLRTPYALQYNLQVERELSKDLLANLAYVGTRGVKLTRFRTPNGGPNSIPIPIDPLGLTAEAITAIALPPLGDLNSPRPTRPLAELGAYTIFDSSAASNYHSLQLSVTKRYAKGSQLTGAYTWSHAIDDVSDVFDLAGAFVLPQDDRNLRAERASANFDVRHRFVWSAVSNVPLLSRFNNKKGAAGLLLGNWQFASLSTYQTGQPFTVNTSYDINLDGNLTDRLDTLNGLQILDRRQQRLALTGTATSLLAPLGRDGRVGRNTFRAAGVAKTDLAVFKNFRFRNEQSLLFRVEVFNLWNRTHFAIPVRILEAPSFGRSVDTLFPARQIQFALKYVF